MVMVSVFNSVMEVSTFFFTFFMFLQIRLQSVACAQIWTCLKLHDTDSTISPSIANNLVFTHPLFPPSSCLKSPTLSNHYHVWWSYHRGSFSCSSRSHWTSSQSDKPWPRRSSCCQRQLWDKRHPRVWVLYSTRPQGIPSSDRWRRNFMFMYVIRFLKICMHWSEKKVQ